MKITAIMAIALFLTGAAVMIWPPESVAQGTAGGRYYTRADVERIIKRVEERSKTY